MPKVVSTEDWLAARKELLAKEKEFTKLRDELSRSRRALPWREIAKPYAFETESGPKTLPELFDGRSQLIVYHFMLGPDWEEGCPSCSYLADHFNPAVVHLAARDVAFWAVSRAPLAKLLKFRDRMGWSFPWASSHKSDFNLDFNVSFPDRSDASEPVEYNYARKPFPSEEAPGASVFRLGDDGRIFHTYSTFARGLDILIGAYNWLDLTPKGRDEDELPFTMAWVRHHDRYEEKPDLVKIDG